MYILNRYIDSWSTSKRSKKRRRRLRWFRHGVNSPTYVYICIFIYMYM